MGILVLVACWSPTAHAQERAGIPEAIRRLAGCYALAVGPWSRPNGDTVSASQVPPSRFELTLEFVRDPFMPDSGRRVGPPFRVLPASIGGGMPAKWLRADRADGDSVIVGWGSDMQGVQLWLALHGDSLVGRAWAWSDVVKEHPGARVVARRVSCTGRGAT